MHLEDLLSTYQVWFVNRNLAVETSRTKQCRVQHVRPVRCSHDDNARIGSKPIHLYQQLVQRVLPLIVATHYTILASGPTDRIDLIDKDDTRCFVLGLPK